MLLLRNRVRDYAWGAIDGLQPIVGSKPSGGPEAELWVGTHPSAPSVVVGDPQGRNLAEVVAADPSRWLGADLAAAGHTALPFLLKVLVIGSPLSLQAHPSSDQAQAGYDREEAAGIACDAPNRTYRDPSPKPESLVALRDTWVLCGFRPPAEAADLVAGLGVPALEPLHETLAGGDTDAFRTGLGWLLRLPGDDRHAVATAVGAAVEAVDPTDRHDPRSWVRLLSAHHPGDPTSLAPLLLMVANLGAGDALHLPAGNLHAYLCGAGVEVMAASDNVLRGGLTPKHIDVEELLGVLRFEPGIPPGPRRAELGDGVVTYDAGEASFGLAVVQPGGEEIVVAPGGPSLLLATDGAVDVAGPDATLTIDHGDAAFVAPGEGPLTVSGPGRLWWATVGDALPT